MWGREEDTDFPDPLPILGNHPFKKINKLLVLI